jgi:hypothetical protein
MIPWVLERARVHDQLGNRNEALTGYQHVADMWRFADPHLQPLVEEARAAIARLQAEPTSPIASE